jgi:hypothetical protein
MWRGYRHVGLLFLGAAVMLLMNSSGSTFLALVLAGYGGFRLYQMRTNPKAADSGALKPDFDALIGAGGAYYAEFLPGGNMVIGQPPNDSGIGVSMKDRVLVVASKGKAKKYSFDDVRGWETKRVDGGRVVAVGGGLAAGINAGTANTVSRIKAMHASGLFIRVKDIENPVWQIHMYQQPLLDKWTEILTQSFGETVA